MVIRAVWNNKVFKIIDSYNYKLSSTQVTFNNLKVDFTGKNIADIPYKYQEIKIKQADTEENILNGEILFTGFLNSINLSEMKMGDEPRELKLELLSPLKLSTIRTVSIGGTYDVNYVIQRVLEPLINDGFILKELNISSGQITVNFLLETIENCMNIICRKRNIFWYINEKKEIYINSIDYLFGLPITKTIDENIKEQGLLRLQPQIQNVDYANVINFKNVRLIYNDLMDVSNSINGEYPVVTYNKEIHEGDMVYFNNPIIVDENQLRNIVKEGNFPYQEEKYDCLYMWISLGNQNLKTYRISLDEIQGSATYGQYVTEGSITFNNDETEGEIVLQRDSFFPNLITGFKWNYSSNARITYFRTLTGLRYTTMKFMYSTEINKLKGIISQTGQIEKTIDYAEKWTSLIQLIDYARSLIVQNSNIVNQIEIEYDKNPNLKLGDVLTINAPSFFINGNFAVQEINYTYTNEFKQIWKLKLKNADMISTYIDLFRPIETQIQEDTLNNTILSEFIEEKVSEKHRIIKVGFN